MRAARRRLLLRAFALLWRYRLTLWHQPFQQVMHHVDHIRIRPERARHEPREVAHALEVGARFVPRATCLVQALAGVRLFAEQGERVRLVFGTRQRAGVLEAHAWLESGERVVVGDLPDLHSYRRLAGPEGV